MSSSTSFVGRIGVLVSVLALLSPTPAHAAPPGDVEHEAEILVEKGKFLAAARLLRDELDRLPENLDNRGRRNLLVSAAVNVYSLAFDQNPKQCEPIVAALLLADVYLRDLLAVYGAAARSSDAYQGVAERRGELDRSRSSHDCPAPTPEPTPPDEPAEPPAAPGDPSGDAPPDQPAAPNNRPLVIGVAISASLTVSMLAISLGTSLSRIKDPFTGAAYERIYDAAVASFNDASPDVDYGTGTNMCQNGREVNNAAVINACDSWDRLGRAAIATGVLTGVFAATTLTLTGVLIHRKRSQARALALVQRHQVFLGATPGARGLQINFGFRF
jgi:hypothetical protein